MGIQGFVLSFSSLVMLLTKAVACFKMSCFTWLSSPGLCPVRSRVGDRSVFASPGLLHCPYVSLYLWFINSPFVNPLDSPI